MGAPSPGPPRKRPKRWRPGQPVIRLMDGQKSLWTAADACLEELYQKMLALTIPRSSSRTLWTSFTCPNMSGVETKVLYHHRGEQQEAFVEDRLLRILQGDVVGVVTGMRRMATQRGLTGEQAQRNDDRVQLFGKQCRADALSTNTCKRVIQSPRG